MDDKLKKEKENYYKNLTGDYYSILTAKEIKYLEDLGIKKRESYIVICDSYMALKKFTCWYLAQEELEYISYSAGGYLNDCMDHQLEVFYKDLLIIRYSKYTNVDGGTGKLLHNTLAGAIDDRNKCRKSTLILAEKEMKYLVKRFDRDVEVDFLNIIGDDIKVIRLDECLGDDSQSSPKKCDLDGTKTLINFIDIINKDNK